MNEEEIIELARDSGAGFACETLLIDGRDLHDFIERFANLIEQRTLERAAQVCDDEANDDWLTHNGHKVAMRCAAAIRELKG